MKQSEPSSPEELLLGLSSHEAHDRLERFGENVLSPRRRINPVLAFFREFSSPLLIILLAVSFVSFFFLGQRTNATIIFAMVLISAVVDFANTFRSERAVERLAERVRTLSRVRRDGKEREVDARSLVPDDIVLLSAGSLIPADADVLEARDFFVNQSAFTGESFPAEKRPLGNRTQAERLTERDDRVFMGTSVVSGFATVRVALTGAQTEYGKIASGVSREKSETDFERNIRGFSLFVMRLNFVLVGLVLLVNTLLGRDFIESLTFSIAIAIGLTPELLPVMLSVSLARGSVRMAKKHAIVKNLSSIQNFGSMTVLCTDKTGTLTQDKITLIKHIDGDGHDSEEVFFYSYLNSAYQTGVKNPLDRAIVEHGKPDISSYEKVDEVPFDFVRRRESLVVANRGKKILTTKGAPEHVLPIVSSIRIAGKDVAIDEDRQRALRESAETLFGEGFRVLAIATKTLDADDYTYDAADESDMTFVGFAAFLDPPKKDAMQTIRELSDVGVAVKILTGDSDTLTRKICADIGIPVLGTVLGKDIDRLSESEVAKLALKTTIFARVTPAEKERIIQALRTLPDTVVGYMGDGINDVTALHAADIGISVENAVPVAKDAANIILLEKSFSVLKDGIEEGRKTFQNTLKYIRMWISSNFGNMFSMMGASAILPFLPMSPQQILLNNFLYDSSQVGLPMDRVDRESITRPARWDFSGIRRFMIIFGTISSVFDFLTFGVLFLFFGLNEGVFQTGWFLESLATQVLVIFIVRTRHIPFFRSVPGGFLIANALLVVATGWLIALSPFGRIFGFELLPIPVFLSVVGITIAYLLSVEIAKRIFEKTVRLEG
ncbi:MAG: magnesium-translocating P-type ATPase [Candidatus Moraniibacteriota bacterium]|nr:MAG: magnesium-translocating P-type ATPase [Candidatus Moranbacteria bacterium]